MRIIRNTFFVVAMAGFLFFHPSKISASLDGCYAECDPDYVTCEQAAISEYNACVNQCYSNDQACMNACGATLNGEEQVCGDNWDNCFVPCCESEGCGS
jgi:hypothetical protein